MPPVFGPRSPSNARLWSWAVPISSACVPSQSANRLASSPARNSSITSVSPAWPKAPAKAERTASSASSAVAATTTPFPAASPSAFTTTGSVCCAT